MVLTPIFELKQDDEFVILVMKIPFLKPSTLDFVFEGREFKFCAHPYFLRLTFPHEIVENGKQKSSYDLEKGELTVYLPKAMPGQVFENLDMITTLMAPKPARPLVQEIPAAAASATSAAAGAIADTEMANATTTTEGENLERMYEKEEQLLERLIAGENVPLHDINRPQPFTAASLLPLQPYGFDNKFSDYFVAKVEHLAELVEVTDPDHMTAAQRRAARLAQEETKFDPEHYMGDYVMDEEIQELLQYQPHWIQEAAALARQTPAEEAIPFTDDEKAVLMALPNRNYLLDNELQTFLGLVDILYAYAYDTRTTMGDHTVESWWTISRLSSTLAWFDVFCDAREVLVACVRRALCYPLYRHWELASLVLTDTCRILANGRRSVVKALVGVKQLFDKSDVRRHLSVLYINDYIVWVQHLSDADYLRLCRHIPLGALERSAVGFPLDRLEEEALNRDDEGPTPIEEN